MGFLVATAAIVALSERMSNSLIGFRPLRDPTAPQVDSLSLIENEKAPQFLVSRDSVELVAPRDITAGDLLVLYHIDYAHVRKQIADQLGYSPLLDSHLIRKGTRLRITLMPPASIL